MRGLPQCCGCNNRVKLEIQIFAKSLMYKFQNCQNATLINKGSQVECRRPKHGFFGNNHLISVWPNSFLLLFIFIQIRGGSRSPANFLIITCQTLVKSIFQRRELKKSVARNFQKTARASFLEISCFLKKMDLSNVRFFNYKSADHIILKRWVRIQNLSEEFKLNN